MKHPPSISCSVLLQDPTFHSLEWAPRMLDPGAAAEGGLTSSLLWGSEHGRGVRTRRVPNFSSKTGPAWLHPSLSDGPPPPTLSSKHPTQTLWAFWRLLGVVTEKREEASWEEHRDFVFSPVRKRWEDSATFPSHPVMPSPLDVIVPVQQLHVIVLQPQVREAKPAGQTDPGLVWTCFHPTGISLSHFGKAFLLEKKCF